MPQIPRNPSSVPDYPPPPSGSQTMPYTRDGSVPGTEEKLLDLCRLTVEKKLLYACGQCPPYPTLKPTTSNDTTETISDTTYTVKNTPPKPWFVRIQAGGDESYFTAKELQVYLTKLLKDNG